MKIIHVNFDGCHGGAAIAAKRINTGLQKIGVNSEMWVARNADTGNAIYCIKGKFFQKLDGLKNILVQRLAGILKLGTCRSYNIFPSRLVEQLNASDADVIHLHWVNAEMVSIAQLAKIKKPVVWTLHDMWAFCGGEHYTTDERYITGYQSQTEQTAKPKTQSSFDIDQWIYRRKQKHWKNWHPLIITPSNWLRQCAEESLLFRDLNVSTIPNCVDLDVFKPQNMSDCRDKHHLPIDKKIILFGAVNPSDERKGGDLLADALSSIKNKDEYAVAIFGQKRSGNFGEIDTYWLGSISSEKTLSEIYNCADLFCVPSRMDNLPNTAVEATACGVPVIAFDVGGLSDIVEHQVNGYLAKPFDPADLAAGIDWVAAKQEASNTGTSKGRNLSEAGRQKAEQDYHNNHVAELYLEKYQECISSHADQACT